MQELLLSVLNKREKLDFRIRRRQTPAQLRCGTAALSSHPLMLQHLDALDLPSESTLKNDFGCSIIL